MAKKNSKESDVLNETETDETMPDEPVETTEPEAPEVSNEPEAEEMIPMAAPGSQCPICGERTALPSFMHKGTEWWNCETCGSLHAPRLDPKPVTAAHKDQHLELDGALSQIQNLPTTLAELSESAGPGKDIHVINPFKATTNHAKLLELAPPEPGVRCIPTRAGVEIAAKKAGLVNARHTSPTIVLRKPKP